VKTGLKVLKIDNTVDFTQYCAVIVSDITVYLLYRSTNASPASMAGLVHLVKSVGKNSIIIGDFNLPDISWKTREASGRAREFVEAADDALLVQMVEFPTHVKGICLDLVLNNIPKRIEEVCEGGRLGQSDHEMICVKISYGVVWEARKVVKDWRRADWQKMRKGMEKTVWRRELRGLTASEMRARFKAKVTATVKKNVPMKMEPGSQRLRKWKQKN
jgi:hypothetical protein